ncbi:MAG: hypothetical protein ACE366_28625 [Bradymonadia bacterium]
MNMRNTLLPLALLALSACGGAQKPTVQPSIQAGPEAVKPGGDKPGQWGCPYCAVRVCVAEDKINDPSAEIEDIRVDLPLSEDFADLKIAEADLMISDPEKETGLSVEVDHEALYDGPVSLPAEDLPQMSVGAWSDSETMVMLTVEGDSGPELVQVPVEVKVETCSQ